MRVGVITECALSRKHGTGAQQLRIFDDPNLEFFHLYLTSFYGGTSECARSFRLEDPRWMGRGRRHVAKLERALGLNWWNDRGIDEARLSRLLQKHHLVCDVAYVSVAGEPSAVQLNSILSVLKVPYVVHVMDVNYEQGFDPATMPGLKQLFCGAACNIALGEAIAGEIRKFGCGHVVEVPIGQDATQHLAGPPVGGQRINILTVGRPYDPGTRLLADAWPRLKERLPNLRLIYAGQHTHAMPAELRAEIDNRGYISDKDVYERVVAESHVGYLSGPTEMDCYGRFSIPSRTSDFLMAGLPVVAAVPDGSATERFLQPLMPTAAATVQAADQVVEAILSFVSDRQHWESASAAAKAFANQNLNMKQVRRRIMDLLESAAKRQGHRC